MKSRIEIILNYNQKQSTLIVLDQNAASPLQEIKRVAKNKLRAKNPSRFFIKTDKTLVYEIFNEAELQSLLVQNQVMQVFVSNGEDFVGKIELGPVDTNELTAQVHIIAKHSFIEQDAVNQIHSTCKKYPNIFLASGMPDLHPGNSFPIGASFISYDNTIYPELVGNDIGCGMALFQMDISGEHIRSKKIKQSLRDMEGIWPNYKSFCEQEIPDILDSSNQFINDEMNKQIGTIGGGNHFAELLKVDEILNESLLPDSFDTTKAFLLVHSGSRGIGQKVLESYKDYKKHDDDENGDQVGLDALSDAGKQYLQRHDMACSWAKANRKLIAKRFHDCLNIPFDSSTQILDVWHNKISEIHNLEFLSDNSFLGPWYSKIANLADKNGQRGVFVHRKGAAPTDEGLVVIPGSRGSYSYLVKPKSPKLDQSHFKNGFSLAHGAGRKIPRGKTNRIKEKIQSKSDSRSSSGDINSLLAETQFQSVVICDDSELLVEEHQDAYKEIDDVIKDLVEFGLIDLVARLKPLVTYKMSK